MVDTPWGEAPSDWESPDWDKHERVHCWRNHISKRLQSLWDSFTSEQKVAIAEQAADAANREEWD